MTIHIVTALPLWLRQHAECVFFKSAADQATGNDSGQPIHKHGCNQSIIAADSVQYSYLKPEIPK
jgi:hypothetical protein